MAKKTIGDISGRRKNQIINAVNNKVSPEEISPPLDEVELDWFRSMEKQKREADEKNGYESFFGLVEIDFDDPCLDIYHEEVWKRK